MVSIVSHGRANLCTSLHYILLHTLQWNVIAETKHCSALLCLFSYINAHLLIDFMMPSFLNYIPAPGLTFDIYEGQITALLGHSGAGKSTLMNILCGICPPTNGSATIYGSPVAEIADGSEMKQLVGICPQFNIIFDVLTVEEHLRIFAAIKGIPPADIDAEVM